MRIRSTMWAAMLALAVVLPTGATALGQDGVTLTLLHNNDGESSLLPLSNTYGEGQSIAVGGIPAFGAVTQREIADARAAGNSVLDVYAGDTFLASATLACSLPEDVSLPVPPWDAVAQEQIPYDLHVFGNHEFDYGPDFLHRFVSGFGPDGVPSRPFISANLDFSGEPEWADWIDADGIVETPVTDGRIVGRSAIVSDAETGERFGIVGATTPLLPSISSPRGVRVTSADVAETAAVVQAEIDALGEAGIDRIILVSHLQDVDNDRELVSLLSGVDIAVAGGGDELLANDPAQLLPGDDPEYIQGSYPILVGDASGREVPIVTTSGNYKYLGRLDVRFDADAEVAEIVAETSYPRRVIPLEQDGDQIAELGIEDAVASDPGLNELVVAGVEECLETFAATPVAASEVLLNLARGATDPFVLGVRSGETNGGNLVADAFMASYDAYAPTSGLEPRGPGNPVITVQNGGGIRQNAGDVLPSDGTPGGIISRLDTINVLPFDNSIVVIEDLPPSVLLEALELSCAGVGGGGFLQVSALAYTCDLSAEPGSRVRDVVVTGGTDDTADDIVVADAEGVLDESAGPIDVLTNSFTADGGDGYEMLADFPATRLLDADSAQIFYERPLHEYLSSFPAGEDGVAVLPADDPRYAEEAGEGRITIIGG